MSISKKQSHIEKDHGKYYFILPDGSDKIIPYANWVEDINWEQIYIKLYRLIQNKDPRVQELDKMNVREICKLFDCCL